MTEFTHDTAPTQYAEAGGIRFAYRRFGRPGRSPLVFFQHFMGTLDDHDPALSDAFASDREVILFDNTGVASSSGTVPDTIEAMARDAITFTGALGLTTIDVAARQNRPAGLSHGHPGGAAEGGRGRARPACSVMIVDEPARIRYYAGGTLRFESQARPGHPVGVRVRWLEPEGPHSVENIDQHRYHAIRVELE